MRSLALTLVVLLVLTAPTTAQPDSATAEVLFREGRRLMAEGNIEKGCTAFEGSYHADPAISTLMNLANCREQNRQYATAWGHFVEVKRVTFNKPEHASIHAAASDRARSLEAKLSYLTINVPDESRIDGLHISRNGVVVDPAQWNRPIPVDGGVHTIWGKAPGHEVWLTRVTVDNALAKQSVTVPRFHPVAADAGTVAADASPAESPHSGLTARRSIALGAWAAGVLALGTAFTFELSGRSTYDDARDASGAERAELYDEANRKHTFAGVAAGAGALLIGTGAVLWWTGSRDRASSMTMVPTVTGLEVRGRF